MNVVQILEDLSEVCRECAEKFGAAASVSENEERRERFVGRSEQWGNYAWDLQEEIMRFGRDRFYDHGRLVEDEDGGAAVLRELTEAKDEAELQQICRKCAENSADQYRQTLEAGGLPDRVRGLLNRQLAEMRRALENGNLQRRPDGARRNLLILS
jgi:hypothetical protein